MYRGTNNLRRSMFQTPRRNYKSDSENAVDFIFGLIVCGGIAIGVACVVIETTGTVIASATGYYIGKKIYNNYKKDKISC